VFVLPLAFIDITENDAVIAFLLGMVGFAFVEVAFHRHLSHRAFKFRNNALKNVFFFVCNQVGVGNPYVWIDYHNAHHRYSDTPKDPHSVAVKGILASFTAFHWKPDLRNPAVKPWLSDSGIRFWHYYGVVIAYAVAIAVACISLKLFWCLIAVPVLYQFAGWVIFGAYVTHKWGYKNFDTKDESVNSPLAFPFVLGLAWHNNHHKFWRKDTTQEKWWELDPNYWIIKAVSK
jgi:stearoyl-CoA desaturase (delta-9 desaturase)